MKDCPFKYKKNIVKRTEESKYANPATFHGDWWEVTGIYDACKLMKSNDDKCIGEDKCPIIKE